MDDAAAPALAYTCADCLVHLGIDPAWAALLAVVVAVWAPRVVAWALARWPSEPQQRE